MKKTLLILALFAVIITGALFLAACEPNDEPEPPTAPTLESSSFAILYTTESDGTANYELTWSAYAAREFAIVCDDGAAFNIAEAKLSLNNFSANEIHTVEVTALGAENLQSEPITVKFKGTKLTMPYNVRLYGDTNSFGWKESDETEVYVVSCEELSLDIQTSRPVYTGKIKTIPVYNNRLPIYDLREIYNRLDLYSLESFRVQALPYNGNIQRFEYEDGKVIEYQLPSDFSEQSVNFYAGQMSNPSNVRWDFDDFNTRSYAYIKWDGADSNYKYKVTTTYPSGTTSSTYTQTGASQDNYSFDSYFSGEYEVTVQAERNEFNFIGEDKNAKWVTYMFYLQQPVTETLRFKINYTELKAPKNVRIEDENIVWDEVEFAWKYTVYSYNEADDMSFFSFDSMQTQASLEYVFNHMAYPEDGEYDIHVTASPISNELVSFENNVPVLNTYHNMWRSGVTKINFVAIPKVQNVQVDYENKTVAWDGIPEATSYSVSFRNDDGGGRTTLLGSSTEYNWYSASIEEYSQMIINAICEYRVETENGVTTMYIPSKYVIEL